ncbi:hypothetical protein K3X44_05830 [Aliiroseovarius crassostreae]|uniref:hypothetical protein n=1 Tax=Aliiroseovarius crassostreae TaxID=154981 RepID=UPI00220BC08A|nr:hypothetical protein [Aliiroseovarius crassostreae]UWQ02839.1 hypothetical protein K3X44_05830 [Aliiroseovarius crassostreae]
MQIDVSRLNILFEETRRSWADHRYTASPEDSIKHFKADFAEIFPGASTADCDAALNAFLDDFHTENVLYYSEAKALIARHQAVMGRLGRDPSELDFYREMSRILGHAKLQNAWVRDKFGPVFSCIGSDGPDGWEQMPTKARQEFRQALLSASPEQRAEFLADMCRLGVQLSARRNDKWRRAGIEVLPWKLPMTYDEQLAEFGKPFTPTPDQACCILEYHCLFANPYTSNSPTLDMNIAKKLAPHLPRGRADLERLVKYTSYRSDYAVKQLLIDALRGTKRTFMDRLIRRSEPLDLPELWPDWIAEKRRELLNAATSRAPFGQASEHGAESEWEALRGQAYDLDVVGYAKRIACAQSCGAEVSTALADLRALTAVMRHNLTALEAHLLKPVQQSSWEEVMPLPAEAEDVTRCPSLYGLVTPPTDLQLAHCEARTLEALDRLIARITLLQRHPGLIVPQDELWLRSDGAYPQYYHAFCSTETSAASFQNHPAPQGLLQRLDGLSFDMLDGPYIVDTEPFFSEVEYKSWRWSIWMLAHLPLETAVPRLDGLADLMFRDHIRAAPLQDGQAGDMGRGHRQAELAGAVISTVNTLPLEEARDFYDRLIARVHTPALKKGLSEQRGKVKRKTRRRRRTM